MKYIFYFILILYLNTTEYALLSLLQKLILPQIFKIHLYFTETDVHYRLHKSSRLVPTLNHIN